MIIHGEFDKIGGWFRINGYGLNFTSNPPLFSEQNGYKKPILKIWKWRLFWIKPNGIRAFQSKAEAVMESIRQAEVGDNVVIHNEDGSIFCVLEVKAKEHSEKERPRRSRRN
jgi:hypothetical protein